MPKPNTTLADNIAYIQARFPHCVTESRNADGTLQLAVDFDLLKQALSDHLVDGEQERYRLDWPGKRAALLAANMPTDKTLRPCRRTSVDFDTTQNLFIEGDNLEALKLLQETYLHKVKMIYIDPPYNTGHDLIYRDSFKQARQEYAAASGQRDASGNRLVANPNSNGRFHSDWLSMMYPRLKLARNLLADDGVIFISIDDNEQDNLKKLCNEIFGERNFVANMVARSNPGGRDYGGIAITHEYILVYAKSDASELSSIEVGETHLQYTDAQGSFTVRELRNRNVKFNRENRPNLYYPFYVNPHQPDANGLNEISLKPISGWVEVYPRQSRGINTVWRWQKSTAQPELNQNIMAKPKRDGGFQIVEKYRSTRKRERSILDDKAYRNEKGTLALKAIFKQQTVFDYPKSDELIKRVVELGCNTDGIVLDFFAGSATTAHAVMQLNATDGGNRRFIMVQLPEACPQQSTAYAAGYQTIADIGKERIRRAGQAVLATNHHAEWQRDIGFRVLNIDSSNFIDTRHTPQQLTQQALRDSTDHIKPERNPEDLLFEVLLNLGLDLRLPLRTQTILDKTILFVGKTTLLACFDRDVSTELAKELVKYHPKHVIFCDRGFASDAMMINVQQIFKQLSPGTEVRVV